jgi:hypothetical protein
MLMSNAAGNPAVAVAEGIRLETEAANTFEELDVRRTCRAREPISLFVYGYTPQGSPFGEETNTIEINTHGALISMKTAVSLGARLLLTNESNQRAQSCTVLAVTARQGRDAEVAIEFEIPAPQFRSPLL